MPTPKLRRPITFAIPSNEMDYLIAVAHQQNMTVSQVAERVISSYVTGEKKVRFLAGGNASTNTVRRALLTAPMTSAELARTTGFSTVTIRTCLIRLEGAGEVSCASPGVSARMGRPACIWALTEEGKKTCEVHQLMPLASAHDPSMDTVTDSPFIRVENAFKAQPTREFTVADVINETKHAEATVRKAIDFLLNQHTIEETGKRARWAGRSAITYRLASAIPERQPPPAAPEIASEPPPRLSIPGEDRPFDVMEDKEADWELAYRLRYAIEENDSPASELCDLEIASLRDAANVDLKTP